MDLIHTIGLFCDSYNMNKEWMHEPFQYDRI